MSLRITLPVATVRWALTGPAAPVIDALGRAKRVEAVERSRQELPVRQYGAGC